MAVVAALKRLLDSDELSHSVRSRDFLAYVVTETMAGRGNRLKERTIARYALGRGGNFDATTNSAARVQANRLRGAMERYYAGSGAAEELVIELPKGSYVPTFTYRERSKAPRSDAALRPGIAVVQFADLRSEECRDLVPRALSDSIVKALSGFPALRIVGPVAAEHGTADMVNARAVARLFDVEYVLTGAVRSADEVLRLTIRVCDGTTGDVLWSENFDRQRSGLAGFGTRTRSSAGSPPRSLTSGAWSGAMSRSDERMPLAQPDSRRSWRSTASPSRAAGRTRRQRRASCSRHSRWSRRTSCCSPWPAGSTAFWGS